MRRTINMFYQCAAVDEVEFKRKGIKRREWRIRLRSGNPRAWLEGPLSQLFERVRAAQTSDRYGAVLGDSPSKVLMQPNPVCRTASTRMRLAPSRPYPLQR